MIKAQIKSGKVCVNQTQVDDVNILSAGGADSSGYLLMGDTEAFYIVETQSDLQSTIDQLVAICEQLKAICDSQYVIGVTGSAAAVNGPMPALQLIGTKIEKLKTTLSEKKLK